MNGHGEATIPFVARRCTLLDAAYFNALIRVTRALGDEGLPIALVGGGAVQAWIASLRTQGGVRRLGDEPLLRTALRKTSDLDFSTRADPPRMLAVLNALAANHGPGAHVLGPRSLRLGAVSLAFTLGPEDLAGMSAHYERFLESRETLGLRRGARPEAVPTIGIEELLATKITRRGDKAKDLLDVTQLVAALRDAERPVHLAEVRELVAPDTEALHLLAEVELALEEKGR